MSEFDPLHRQYQAHVGELMAQNIRLKGVLRIIKHHAPLPQGLRDTIEDVLNLDSNAPSQRPKDR